jgi:peptide deformylase
VTPAVLKILNDMADTLYAANGAGLAAPQIGIGKQISVIDYHNSGLIEFINPEIVDRRGEQEGWEACLSIPGFYGRVRRSEYVKVRSLNRTGEEVFYEGEGPLAVAIQHEIDHLHGILYIDSVNPGQLFSEKDNQAVDVVNMIQLSRKNLSS